MSFIKLVINNYDKQRRIFDRDGTLIRYLPYLSNSKDIELVSGVSDVLKQLKKMVI